MWIGLVLTLLSAEPNWKAHTVTGETRCGTLAEMAAEGVVLQTADGRVTLPLDQILDIVPATTSVASDDPSVVWVELIDSSALAARSYTVSEGQATIGLAHGKSLAVPTAAVAQVRFQTLAEPSAAEWSRLLTQPRDTDLLVIRKDEAIDYHNGVVRDVTAAEVLFEVDGDRLPVKRSNVVGLLYYHPPGEKLPDSICTITDAAGSCYAVHALRLDQAIQATTPAGLAVSLGLDEVCKFEFANRRIVYLSDLKPDNVEWVPFFAPDKDLPLLAQFYRPRQDCGFDDDPLRLGGRVYRKGLALHSRTLLTYRLPDRFRTFKASVGIADAVRPRGKVHVVIQGDGRILWEQDASGRQDPAEVSLAIGGVRRLSILVDFGGSPSAGDQLFLCKARVIK